MAGLCFAESRPTVQGMFLLRFLTAALLAATTAPFRPHHIISGAVSLLCASVSIYVYNGLTDITGDRVNGSGRPIADGRLTIEQARAATLLLSAVAVAVAAQIGAPFLWPVVAMLALGWAYSAPALALKRWPVGTSSVAAAGGMAAYLAGWYAGGATRVTLPLVVMATSLSLWMGIVGGLTKDLSDTRGDAVAGRRTVPIVLGERRARAVAAFAALFIGTGSFYAMVHLGRELWPIGVTLTFGGLIILACAATLPISNTRGLYRVFMATQYFAHGIGACIFVTSLGLTRF